MDCWNLLPEFSVFRVQVITEILDLCSAEGQIETVCKLPFSGIMCTSFMHQSFVSTPLPTIYGDGQG